MQNRQQYSFAACAFLAVTVTVPSFAAKRPQSLKLNARFLATSTSVHSSVGENQDVYLIETSPTSPGSDRTLARLIDEYPAFRGATALPTASATAMLTVWQDHSCELPFGQMPLRTPPGDPSAVLNEPLHYRAALPLFVNPGAPLPCYRVVRH